MPSNQQKFQDDFLAALSQPRKSISPRYLYDFELTSHLSGVTNEGDLEWRNFGSIRRDCSC
jgi:hypothetical protein